ncbi:flavodoxin family protein, partial [Myxococcus xanthus]
MAIAKWGLLMLTLPLVLAVLVPIAVTLIEKRQARALQGLDPYVGPLTAEHGGAAVVYFSRSGNTALAARHIANRLGAQLFELDAPDYRLGLAGWANAMHDARGEEADITPREMDLSRFDQRSCEGPVAAGFCAGPWKAQHRSGRTRAHPRPSVLAQPEPPRRAGKSREAGQGGA